MIQAYKGAKEDILTATKTNEEVYDFLRDVSSRYGIGFWKPGAGIIHQVVLELSLIHISFQENPEASKLIRRYNARIVEVNPVFSIVEKNGMSEDITSLYGELRVLNLSLIHI